MHPSISGNQATIKTNQIMNDTIKQNVTNLCTERTVGIELEFDAISRENLDECLLAIRERGVGIYREGYNHSTRNHWKVVPDGSLSGGHPMELVSPPLTPLQAIEQLEVILDVLNEEGCQVNRSCGFHIHHHAPRYNAKRLKYLVNHFVKNERNFDSIVSPSRRHSQWAQSNKQHLRSMVVDGVVNRCTTRYLKLNLQAFARQGTIEIRQHQGTLDLEKIAYWIIFTQALVTRCYRKVTETDGYDNPMHNYVLACKWGSEYQGGILAKDDHSESYLMWLVARMDKFGVQKPFKLWTRAEVSAQVPTEPEAITIAA
jgi:hypothetical protein